MLVNVHISHDDEAGSVTQHLNVEPDRVPELLAGIDWATVREYRVVRVSQ